MDGMFSAPCSSAAAPRARARARAMRRITGAGFRVRNCARVYLGAGAATGALRGVRVMPSQHDKAMRFRALHETPGIFVIPNVWDGGSASVMAGLGFEALATSSAAWAAAEAAHRLRFPFTLTARAENFLHDKPDLDDTVRRLQAFERAGADVLFAPGLPDLAAVRIVCSALAKPVNFMVGIRGRSFALADLAAAGVRRVSLSTSLYRAAITAVFIAAREAKQVGTFGYVETLMKGDELTGYLRQQALARNAA